MAFYSSFFYDQDPRLNKDESRTLWTILKVLLIFIGILLALMFSSCGSSKRMVQRERTTERDSIRYSLARLDSVHVQRLRSDTIFSRVFAVDSLTFDAVATEEIWNVETETITTDSLGRPVRHLQRQTHTLKHRKERKQQQTKRDSIVHTRSSDVQSTDSLRKLTSSLSEVINKTSDKFLKQKEHQAPPISFMDRLWLKVTHRIGWLFFVIALIIILGINLKKIRIHLPSFFKWFKRLFFL